VEARFKTLQLVWAALMFGVASFSIVVYSILTFTGVQIAALPADIMPYVVPIAFLGMIAGSIVRRRLIDAIPRDSTSEARMERYTTATIVGCAMTEGFGLLVIVLSLVTGAAMWALVGAGLALGVLAMASPDRREAGLPR
jgi:hypothetical protein